MVHFVDTLSSIINSKTLSEDFYFQFLSTYKGKPAALVHYVALLGKLSKVQITHCRWRCGTFVTQLPLSVVIVYDLSLLLSMMYQFQRCLEKTDCKNMDNKPDKPSIAI